MGAVAGVETTTDGSMVLTAPASSAADSTFTGVNQFANNAAGTVSAASQIFGTLNNIINPPKVVQSQVPVVQQQSPIVVSGGGMDKTTMYMIMGGVGLLVLVMAMK